MKTVSTSVEEDVLKRAEEFSKRNNLTLSNVIELCVLRGLPELEAEILGPQFVGGIPPPRSGN